MAAGRVMVAPLQNVVDVRGIEANAAVVRAFVDGIKVGIGHRVVLHSLSAKGGAMNGRTGRVVSFADGRHVVQLDAPEGRPGSRPEGRPEGGPRLVKVKPENVRPAPD